jgi:phosphoglycerol transferase MdoB-like AlkP superfamily enzyme
MRDFIKNYLLKRIAYLVLLLQIMRIIFYVFNHDAFMNDKIKIVNTFFCSIPFDVASVLLYLIPYCIILAFLLLLKNIRRWQTFLLDIYFIALYFLISVLSFADVFYYRFTSRRINIEALDLLHDAKLSIFRFAKVQPISVLLMTLLIVSLVYCLQKSRIKSHPILRTFSLSKVIIGFSIYFSVLAFLCLKFNKYLSPISASLVVSPGYTGLYTNSSQVFIYSYFSGWTYVQPVQYMSDEKVDEMYPVFYANKKSIKSSKRNVMLFILESFSYSYLDAKNPQKPSTPFFDSLILQSTFYEKAYANNMTSANGLSSMLSGLPSLTTKPFFSSAYCNNPIDALGIALTKNGYETYFSMGANEDHFGFKKGTRLLGIHHYISGDAMPRELHDGTWGIFDEPFLQDHAKQVRSFKQPFFSVLFTISSHHPFRVPDSLLHFFPTLHDDANERAVAYVDYSFRHFFDKVKDELWFQNTIFIFTGDHVSRENRNEIFNFNSSYHIPIFVFDPQHAVGKKSKQLIQHIDFPATIAQLTGITDTILSFGKPFDDSVSYRFTMNRYDENIIQMIDSNSVLQYDFTAKKMLGIYRIISNDSIVEETNLKQLADAKQRKLKILEACMQQYFNRLFYNQLYKGSFKAK